MEEVMKIQMMKKEEYCENIKEEFVTLRVEVFNLIKNVQERESSTLPIKKFEEKCYRLLERKNEEKAKTYVLAANSHFYTVLISCLHQCFANLDFRRNLGIKQHYYFTHLHICLCSCFHDCKRENFVFEVTLKSSLDCYGYSCRYVHSVSILIMIIQLTRLQDSLLIWHFCC
jgi:hypothetical protein